MRPIGHTPNPTVFHWIPRDANGVAIEVVLIPNPDARRIGVATAPVRPVWRGFAKSTRFGPLTSPQRVEKSESHGGRVQIK